ncbi:glycosyltransferase family 2 protein [Dyella silvae]|uniref:glycosyltransferase family 2 protein n=1 Tax=Dyella silvae TaxID=2994424 RepID=UPI002263F00D|nr:glycosyltransferase family 2 protein [Dyella silvae]
MSDPRLSIVLCTYNGVAFLPQQLESLLNQTRLPDEIVIGDDSSLDHTWDLLQTFAGRAQSSGVDVKLVRHATNLGYVGNFSAMLQQATGDLLFLSDQDDVWRADKLEVMASRFQQDRSLVLLHSDARLVDEKGDSLRAGLFESLELSEIERQRVRADAAFDVLLRRNIVTGATAGMRRIVVEKALPIPSGWVHDEWLALVASVIGRVDFIDEPLIDYRQHGNNQIGIQKRTWKKRLDDLLLPRAKEIGGKVARLGGFADHLRTIDPFPAHQLERVKDMQAHLLVREQIRGVRVGRLMSIWREYANGRYRRYDTGARGALRDFLRRD